MARLKQKGKAGAAKAYVTRTSAVKKLQISLADFRRLCILKGIFPREPRNKKKANKGSSVPTTFYYAKDIAYLAHEPVLKKLREHKAFAKKLARALGRSEWSSAKSLEDNKPVYTLDHVIKERYPTFIDAVRDIDDALCLVALFASLPANQRIPSSLTQNCSRLTAEWQLYVMHTRALRKVFLSIKGVYYQAEVMGQTITWLVPYQFAQSIPPDVDARVMLTFLELYQTLLGFVFFKLFTDASLVYPPPMDALKDEAAAGVGAFSLQEKKQDSAAAPSGTEVRADGKKVTGKDVRATIKSLAASVQTEGEDEIVKAHETAPSADVDATDDFVAYPSTSNPSEVAELPTLHSISTLAPTIQTKLFASCVFFLSRESPRSILEFVIRSFGGRVGWPASVGSGSPYDENDESITHVIIDRPVVEKPDETPEEKERRRKRKYVQPQWVVDCINKNAILLEEPYLQGKILPPHLSPFGETIGAYDPEEMQHLGVGALADEEDEEMDEEADADVEEDVVAKAVESADPALLHAAELAAEAAGVDSAAFEQQVGKAARRQSKKAAPAEAPEEEMNKMMMSSKKRKLYEKMKYGERKRAEEKASLEQKRKHIAKRSKA
ncbi:pescadillo-family protein [Exidia glandulosa HHB12029]|uniref:Pescadillo homolog n=1 Tax=Exidia glandulosa HHB12029 TaxID=1314781 RepID=A0A166AI82_EXIGL|nr:pescadillo-family protein [Exidia glandulosa HHB12029]